MAFKISWDTAKIIADLRSCALQAGSHYNDGFTAWHCKQDLLQVQYELENMLRDLPKFQGEDEYITQLEKQQVWRVLNRK
jgi:hypothetical protein